MTVGWGDSMQIVGPLGNPAAAYGYWNPAFLGLEGDTCYWTDETFEKLDVSFDAGDGFAIDNPNGLTFNVQFCGEVPTKDVSFAAGQDLNWSGNPFPATIGIDDVQLDDGGLMTVGWGDSMQIVGPLGNPAAAYGYWDPSFLGLEGDSCYWTDETFEKLDVKFGPGDGFAIDNPNGLTFDIKIAKPYTL